MNVPTANRSWKVPGLRRAKPGPSRGVTGVAKLDKRTKRLTKRIQPGEIAVIDHVDIDRVSAEALVRCGVGAVINAAASISGRYPNLGPQILLEAGIVLVDDVGQAAFEKLKEGTEVRVCDGLVHVDDEVVAKGNEQTAETVDALMAEARAGLSVQIEAFTVNTMEYVRRERELLLDGVGVPDVETSFEGRHVLVVVRGYHYREDLLTLQPYIREYRPVMVGVDGGADALMEAGYLPDMVVGDFDSVSDKALTCGAELVVHAYRDGRAPGLERVQNLGLDAVTFPAAATSEDIAVLLADEKEASLIVTVGSHGNLEEFLDKGRAGMASTFLTRLRVGSKLVDAKGVSLLYRSRISTWSLLWLISAAVVCAGVVLYMSPVSSVVSASFSASWNSFTYWLTELFQ